MAHDGNISGLAAKPDEGVDEHSGGGRLAYHYAHSRPNPSHRYLWPAVRRAVERHLDKSGRALDLGCGNGSTSNMLREMGFEAVGIDPSEPGISIARSAFPGVEFHVGNGYDDIAARHGRFKLIVSLEVIEHLFDPRRFVQRLREAVDDDGICVVSTPYCGYWKNLAVALAGRWDHKHQPLWLGGHIKFFSMRDLRKVLTEEGFQVLQIERVGRTIPALAMSMVAVVRRA
jgi:2-polyprenyl-6-hydroxyphenyl methylase/3-demethylubiquinone-9 3-methyltransferase